VKLLLVDNLVMPEEGSLDFLDVHPHLGLLSLAAVAEAHGHHVRIYDPKRLVRWGQLPYDATLYGRVARELLAERADAVGFTTLGCSFLFALNVAAALKRDEPDLPILLGGPHATMLHEPILRRFAQFDVIVRHEAEETLPAVLAGLDGRDFEGIPGVSWRRRDGLALNPGRPKVDDLDRLPLLSYDHYPVADLGLDLLRIEAGRGCPFACTFCSTASFFQRSFRLKSAGRLVAELDRLHERYGHADFKLDHDLFTVNRHKILEFCEAVAGRGYRWRASARVDCVDPELLAAMAAAGCVGLYFGIETGSARMQKIVKKHLDLALVEPTLRLCETLGIDTTASFITGYPEERADDQAETLDLLGRCLRPSCLPQLHVLAPEPGTPMFERLGDRLEYDGYAGPYNAHVLAPGDEALITRHPDIFQTYHHYPAEMPRERYTFAVETIDVVRRVDPRVLRYTLRVHDGRLSRLVEAFRRWAETQRWTDRPDAELFESYVQAAFGPRHHVTSLFRHAFELDRRRRAPAAPTDSRPPVYDPEQPCRLARHLRVLGDVHDCGRLLERIAEDPDGAGLLDDAETGDLGAYLIDGVSGTVHWVDAGVEAILTLFYPARSCREVSDLVREAVEGAALDAGFFERLVHAGILVAAEPEGALAPVP
jgi:radical SAM superfamily enzyme YgiQ (UPF0313 family)